MKTRILISIGVFLLAVAVGAGVMFHISGERISNAEKRQRAEKLGTGLGTMASIGFAVIWLPYAAQVGKRKRAEKLQKAQSGKRKRRRPRKQGDTTGLPPRRKSR